MSSAKPCAISSPRPCAMNKNNKQGAIMEKIVTSPWQRIFLASRVNGNSAPYEIAPADAVNANPIQWPTETYFQRRLKQARAELKAATYARND